MRTNLVSSSFEHGIVDVILGRVSRFVAEYHEVAVKYPKQKEFVFKNLSIKITKNELLNLFEEVKKGIETFVLMDDCMYDNKFMRDTCIRQCFMNGRHWKIFFMLTMQYCMDLPPALRANVDYVFILRENIIQNREKLYKSFFGIFPSFDMFNKVMDACTENYECIVLDNTSKSNRIEDCVFWYCLLYTSDAADE